VWWWWCSLPFPEFLGLMKCLLELQKLKIRHLRRQTMIRLLLHPRFDHQLVVPRKAQPTIRSTIMHYSVVFFLMR